MCSEKGENPMKKLMLLIALFTLSLSSAAFAMEFPARWHLTTSDDQTTAYIDSDTLHYDKESDTVDVWEMLDVPSSNTYSRCHAIYSFRTNTVTVLYTAQYHYNENSPYMNFESHDAKPVSPMSLNARIMYSIAKTIGRLK